MLIIIATNLRALLNCGNEIPIARSWRNYLSYSAILKLNGIMKLNAFVDLLSDY